MTLFLAESPERQILEPELQIARPEARITQLVHSNSRMHPFAYRAFAVVNVAILGVFGLVFWKSAETLFMVVISSFYLAAYLGVPTVMNRASRFGPSQTKSLSRFLKEPYEISTGVIKGWEAIVQILLVPTALLVAVIGIGIIIGINQ